jgi:hypothetical protein
MAILLPTLSTAWERAKELNASEPEINDEQEVYLEIQELFDRKSHEGIFMILIEPPAECRDCRVSLKRPYPRGMKLVRRHSDRWKGRYYLKWRPKTDQLGEHKITVAFTGKEPSELEFTAFVYNEELLKKQMEEQEKNNNEN